MSKLSKKYKYLMEYPENHTDFESGEIVVRYIAELREQKEELIKQVAACIHHMFDSDTVVKSAVQNSATKSLEEIAEKTFDEILKDIKELNKEVQ